MPRKTVLFRRPESPARHSRFNEAAARCRGKPPAAPTRPSNSARFNEAAARCRGKPEGKTQATILDYTGLQ